MVIFLFCCCSSLSLSAQNILTKKIDFAVKNIPVADALIELSETANIDIAFHPRLFSNTQMVSGVFKNKSLDYILHNCLVGTKVNYKLEGDHLILYQKPPRKITISGYIEDAKTGERLVAATIWEANSGRGSTTNDYGFFSLRVPEGAIELQGSYLGYQGEVQSLKLYRNTKITISLSSDLTLEEVVVLAKDAASVQTHLGLGKGSTVDLQGLTANIALGGEADLMRFLSNQAEVQSGADGIGGLTIRGGNSDQNLVLMDGVPIYNPSHSLGLFSVFNSPIIKSAQLLTDGFSAKYGGRLSSVIDVRIKEGSTKEWKGEGAIGTIATKLIVEGPIQKDKSGLLLAMRRTHIDPLLKKLSRKAKLEEDVDGQIGYHFFDINAKFHHRFSQKDQLFLSFYKGQDDFKNEGDYVYEDPEFGDYIFETEGQEITWGNEIAALRWNHLFGNQLFSNTTFTLSRYNYNSLNTYDYQEEFEEEYVANYSYYTFVSKIRDAGIKIDFEYYPRPQHQILFGGGFLARSFESGDVDFVFEDIGNEEDFEDAQNLIDEVFTPPLSTAQEANIYLEDKMTFNEKFSVLGGMHIAAFFTDGTSYIIPQPRLVLQWMLSDKWRTNLSIGKMSQFLHILSTTGGGLPNDLWVPSTQNVRPETAWQVTGNIRYKTPKGWSVTADVFYKKLAHLIAYIEETRLPSLTELDPTYWEENITFGEGESYGASMHLEKKMGTTTGQINYAYTISERQFELNNNGLSHPYQYTHKHSVHVGGKQQLTSVIALFADWQFGSGQPYSLIETDSRFAPLSNFSNDGIERIGSTNGHLLPAYHRLDVGVHFQWSKQSVDHSLQLGAYNVYNRKNPYYQYLIKDSFLPEDDGLKQQNALPLLPSLAYRIVF